MEMMFRRFIACWLMIEIATGNFAKHKLNDVQLKDSHDFAKFIRPKREKEETGRTITLTKDKQPWYKPVTITDERYNALGKLFIYKINSKSFTISRPPKVRFEYDGPFHCTAFYVAPDILATAAHCLNDAGITPDSGHVLLFRQQYDGSKGKYTDDTAADYERVITEWIYLEGYKSKPTGVGWCRENNFDFAFMRTHAPAFGGDKVFYMLASPDDFLKNSETGPQVKIVGYPLEYAQYFEPVAVSCTLAKASSSKVQEDLGILKGINEEGQKMSVIEKEQLFCVSDLGNMQAGGSGSPWFLDESAIPTTDSAEQRKKKLRTVYGISSWAFTRKIKDPAKGEDAKATHDARFTAAQEFCKATMCTWLKKTGAMGVIARFIRAKSDETFEQAYNKNCPAMPTQ